MSQMFLFNNLTQGRAPLKAGVNPARTAPGSRPRKGCTGTEAIHVGFPLGPRYTEGKFKTVHLVKEINNL